MASKDPISSVATQLIGDETKESKQSSQKEIDDITTATQYDETLLPVLHSASILELSLPLASTASHSEDVNKNSSTQQQVEHSVKSESSRRASEELKAASQSDTGTKDRSEQVNPPSVKVPNVVNTNFNSISNNTKRTRPLVINHSSSTTTKTISDKPQNETVSTIIPVTLSSQLIFSSIITQNSKTSSPQQKSTSQHYAQKFPLNNQPSSKQTTPLLQPKVVSITKATNCIAETTPCELGSTSLNEDVKIANRKRLVQASPTQSTNLTASQTSNNNGLAVSARLIDMGKKLLDATREGSIDQVRQLVVNSGAPFTSDWLGTTALHLAAQNGNTEIAEILLKGGVNRDARTKLDRTALHLAAQCGSVGTVELLISYGSDVNARDMLRMTPLHWAVERGHIGVIERLLLAGADLTLRSKFQLTPIDIAQSSKCYEIVELFKGWRNCGDDDDMCSSVKPIFHSSLHTPPNIDQQAVAESSSAFSESQNYDIDFDCHLALVDSATTSRASILDINEPCIDLVELEWNKLDFETDFFLPNEDEDEPKVEYLMKIVEELQKENKQLRQKVEQLSTTSP